MQFAGRDQLGIVTQFNAKVEESSRLKPVSMDIDELFSTAQEPTATFGVMTARDPRRPSRAGMEELDKVIIKRTVGARPNAEDLTINATGMYVVGK